MTIIDPSTSTGYAYGSPRSQTAISWPAIFGGAVAAVAISLSLLVLGSGLGLAVMSPFSSLSDSAAEFTVKAAVWLVFMQWVASAIGGYLAGRLRTKWRDVPTDEVFFRDTAHGFLTWALATALTAACLTGTVSSVVGTAAQSAATVAATQTSDARVSLDPLDYYVDGLYRNPRTVGADNRAETYRIVAKGVSEGSFSNEDRAYLTDLVAARAGVAPAEASTRVDKMVSDVNAAAVQADEARKDAAKLSTLVFLSFLVGAFVACYAALFGGRHRDD